MPFFQNETVFKNLFECNITNDNVSNTIISYLNENIHTYRFINSIDQQILEIITNTNIIDGEFTIVNNIGEEFHICILLHNKQGHIYHKIEDDFILKKYKIKQKATNHDLLNIKYTFVKKIK